MASVGKIAARWLNLASESMIEEILPSNGGCGHALNIEGVFNTGHRHKILVAKGDTRYVCQLSLRRAYTEVMTRLHRLGRECSVPLAPVVRVGRCWKRAVPVHYLILGWMPGEPCNKSVQLSESQLVELGRVFGRLHSINTNQWERLDGRWKAPVEDSPSARLRWTNEIQRMRQIDHVPDGDIDRAMLWLDSNAEVLEDLPSYSLLHGDPHGNNIVIDGDEFGLIDTDQMTFGFAPFELFKCMTANYAISDTDRQLSFANGYRETVDRALWKLWQDNMAFTAARVFLWRATQSQNRIRHMSDPERKAIARRSVARYWRGFISMTAQRADNVSDLEQVMAIYRGRRL